MPNHRRVTLLALPFAFALLALGLQAGQPTAAADLNRPVPERARRLQQEGRRLAEQEKLAKAEAKFRRAIQLAPQFVQAHLDLVRLKVYYLQDLAGAAAEYRALAAAEPRNPLFPLVLATSWFPWLQAPEDQKELLRQAADLVPEWSWAHMARARLLWQEKKYGEMVPELEQLVAKQSEFRWGWRLLANGLEKLERWHEAAHAYRKLAELRGDPFSSVAWRLQLKLAGQSEAARAHLREELERWQKTDLAPRYRRQVAYAYRRLLDDEATAQAIEEAVERDHPEREVAYSFESSMAQILGGKMDEPERMLAGGRQAQLYIRLLGASANEDAAQKVAGIGALLQERPQPSLRRLVQQDLLEAQIEAKDWPGARATLAEIVASKPESVGDRFKLALALADNKVDLDQALRLVEEAQALRQQFQPWVRPKQFRVREWEKRYGSPERQHQAYNNTLATLADARGWVLAQQGNLEEAEQELRSAVGLNSSQQAQYHLGVVLDRRGETQEALDLLAKLAAQKGSLEKVAREAVVGILEKQPALALDALIERAHKALVEEKREGLAKELIQEPAQDFELVALDGQSYRLSDLRGKVVLIDFFATW